jgi:hypothetical protein
MKAKRSLPEGPHSARVGLTMARQRNSPRKDKNRAPNLVLVVKFSKHRSKLPPFCGEILNSVNAHQEYQRQIAN